jgi:adenylate cyclase
MSTAGTTSLDAIRPCFEGAIPAVMATCAADGTPNVAYISQVYYVDARHVALSFQFFNTTRKNILANPVATVLVLHPQTAAFFRLHIRYLRTETDRRRCSRQMKAQLAGIASHTGMDGVFTPAAARTCTKCWQIESVARPAPAHAARRACGLLGAVRRCSERHGTLHRTMDELLNAVLGSHHRPDGHPARHGADARRGARSACTRWPAAAMPPPAWARKSKWAKAWWAWLRASARRCASGT